MSSSRPSQAPQVFQDYIAKIRYSNQLPPPPNPPKLLDIPGTGLSSKYTSAGYASRLVREQPLNIEADAELGMHIDLVGIPGVFDGDERAISADPHPPLLHASDKALLKPLASLSKVVGISDSSSFLRRTEYTASSGPQMFASGSSKDLLRSMNPRNKTKTNLDKEDPRNILRNVIKGFNIAYPQDASKTQEQGAEVTPEESKAWTQPKHPSKQHLTLLDSYPLLPDLDALPESGSFVVCKFTTNPVANIDTYDQRLDQAVFQPVADARIVADYNLRKADWDEASGDPEPLIDWEYDFFLPESESVQGVKRKLDVQDADCDDDELYTDTNSAAKRVFKYPRLRRYETYTQTGDMNNLWNDSISIALHDPELDVSRVAGSTKRLPKGAYIYPVSQRSALRPKRKVGAASLAMQDKSDLIDEMEIRIVDGTKMEALYNTIKEHKIQYHPTLESATNGVVAIEA